MARAFSVVQSQRMRQSVPWLERVAIAAVGVTASVVLVMALAGTDPAGPKRDVARGGDLVAFWAGGAVLAEDGHGRDLYKASRYREEMAHLFPRRPPRYQLAYPPPIYQACALAHGLGYAVGSRAFVLGMSALFALGVLLLVETRAELGPRRWLVGARALASPSMWMMVLTGQFSGAWLLLVALGFGAVRRVPGGRWWWLAAGLPLGVLCVKPTLAVAALAAVVVVGSGRALVGFLLGGGAVLAASLTLHGAAPWRGYLAMVADNPDLTQQMWLMPERQLTARTLLGLPAEPFGAEVVAGWAGTALAAVLLAWVAPVCWRGPAPTTPACWPWASRCPWPCWAHRTCSTTTSASTSRRRWRAWAWCCPVERAVAGQAGC